MNTSNISDQFQEDDEVAMATLSAYRAGQIIS